MTDRELLELAAKAYGIEKIQIGDDDIVWASAPSEMEAEQYQLVFWNPLIDDGDALRLAVKLNIDINFDFEADLVSVTWPGSVQFWSVIVEDNEADWYKSTRLAIVKAASEIGKAQQGE